MHVVVKKLQDTVVTYQQLAELLHDSFQERLDQGLHFTCSRMTAEQYEAKVKDGYVFVALDSCTGDLLGTATLHIKTDSHGVVYGYNEYLAVSPKAKHFGVGTMLLNERLSLLLSQGGKYVMSDTACGATSSVKWHQKNGFQIYELESYRSTNYWSYVFIKYLDESIRRSILRIKVHYWMSWIFIRITRNINGQDTTLGKLYKIIKGKWKN